MRNNVDAHIREMTNYLFCKEYSENYQDKVPPSILRWITDPSILRFSLITEEMQGDKGKELSAILEEMDNTSDFLMRHHRVKLIKRDDCLEVLSNLKVFGTLPNKALAHYANMVLRCLSDYLD